MAQQHTLASSLARTADGTGGGVLVGGYRRRVLVVFSVTASAHEAGDTLDAYVDVSPDGNLWVNAVHFAQQAGNGAAKTEIAVLESANPGTDTVNVTANAAAGKVRPAVWGKFLRARWVIADSGDADSSHTFSVVAFVE